MPTYLCHGFRWHRRAIRVFVILNELDECAPDWLVGKASSELVLRQFAQNFDFLPSVGGEALPNPTGEANRSAENPQAQSAYDDDYTFVPTRASAADDNILMHTWSPVKLLEEYDETETVHASRPYAYVADYVLRIDLGIDIGAEMKRHTSADWFGKLRDKLQEGQEMGWYVVVCDDCDRFVDDSDDDDDGTATEDGRSPNQRDSVSTTSSAASEGPGPGPGPAFLKTDPYERPPPKLRKKLSIKRLFKREVNE